MATSPWYYIASCVSLLGRVSAWVSDDLLALWVCKGTRWGTGGDRNSSCPWTSKDRTQGDYVTELICMITPWIFTFIPWLDMSMGIFISAIHSCGRCDEEEGEESDVEQTSQKEDGWKNKWVQPPTQSSEFYIHLAIYFYFWSRREGWASPRLELGRYYKGEPMHTDMEIP